MASSTALSNDAAASSRQRPEEILAQTLSAPLHPEATDGWSSRGRRLFLIAMAAAGVILLVAGLLVSKELAPGPGNPAPLQTGGSNGLANQLLQSSTGDQTTPTAVPGIGVPLPTTPTTRSGQNGAAPPAPLVAPSPSTHTNDTTPGTTPTTRPQQTTTTLPCGLLGQGLQSAQIPVCKSSTRSTL